MPPLSNNGRHRLLLFALVWSVIQGITGFWILKSVRSEYIRCQYDPTCKGRDIAQEWDTKRTYVSLASGNLIQALGSALVLGRMVQRSKSLERQIARAIGAGVIMAAVAGVCAVLIYDHYPRPYYWTLDFSQVMVFGYYFMVPIFPLASAVLGGIVCGLINWKILPRRTA